MLWLNNGGDVMSGSKIGRAVAIFNNIDNDKFSDEEKALAIYDVMNMPTHNGVTKEAAFKALSWLWHKAFELEQEGDENEW